MKRAFLVGVLLFFSGITLVSADIDISFDPEPLQGQLWARETYLLNVSGPKVDLSEYSPLKLSGNLVYNGSIQWRGVGQYHHGSGVTGYSYDLSMTYFQNIESLDAEGTSVNITLENDAYRYGMKPFEEVQIIFRLDVYLEGIEDGTTVTGPLVESKSRTLILVDEDKVDYLQDKFEEMQSEINLTLYSVGLEEFNRSRYSDIIDSMNQSLVIGDYTEALEQWEDWDNKGRLRMFTSFTNKVDDQSVEFEALKETEENLENLQTEYDFLEDKYVAIFGENRQNLTELEATKQGLTTAITGVFLSAMVFFFLGRRSNNGADE
jgi:hypothetical protein